MKTKATTLLVTALLGLGVTANAVAATVYTDRALFEAAFLSAPTIEDFEHYVNNDTPPTSDPTDPIIDPHPHLNMPPLPPNGLTSLTLDYFELTADRPAIKIGSELDYPGQYDGSINTTLGGTKFLYLDTDDFLVGSETVFELNSPVNAFGFNYTGVFGPDDEDALSTFEVTVNSETFRLNGNNPEDVPLFWGVIGPANFTTATLLTSLDSGYGVDDVTFGSAIPLPPALWLFGSGLLALAGSGMKKKIRS
jgi:hypothetical protein